MYNLSFLGFNLICSFEPNGSGNLLLRIASILSAVTDKPFRLVICMWDVVIGSNLISCDCFYPKVLYILMFSSIF